MQQIRVATKQGAQTSAIELHLQYDVQVDVVLQLEDRVKQKLKAAPSTAPQIVKLKRDFERVQARVVTLKQEAERLAQQRKTVTQSVGATGEFSSLPPQASEVGLADAYQQMQLQMQNDVSL